MAPTSNDAPYVDYYELLSITQSASEAEIRRAYRKTSLLYHPDKVTPTPENLDKFQLLQTALNILTDPEEKSKYDQERSAKQRRAAETAALDSRRRQMVEDLERREREAKTGTTTTVNGVKRTWTEREWTDRELKIKRIQEENRQRMAEKNKQRREAAVAQAETAQAAQEAQDETAKDRTVKVCWIKEGSGLDIDQETIEDNFAVGDVDNIMIMSDKKGRVEGRGKKALLGRAFIVFKSEATAKKVVAQGPWDGMESVDWVATKER